MHLASDFEFKPLPPIEGDETATAGGVSAASFSTAAAAPNPLGRLAAFKGKWSGTGFNQIWRPNHKPSDQDTFLELNLTSETLEFEPIKGAIPNRGFLQGDINMFGVSYLQQIQDSNLKAGLHFEPGMWLRVPSTSHPKEPATLVRMASIPHGTTIVAQGISSQHDGPPTIPAENIRPFSIGFPDDPIDFDEMILKQATKFRTPKAGLVGITQKMVDDPNSVLRAAIAKQTILSTSVITVSTSPKPILGGGTANTAFLKGDKEGPNANAVTVTSTFWIETVKGTPNFTQIQYSQKVLLNFNDLSWPHVTVGTLRQVT
jgi:hypothetical protein